MKINTTFDISDTSFKTDFSGVIFIENDDIIIEGDSYEGEYEVIPKVYEEQELETKYKILTENVIIKEIPISETSNESGGLTLYIGG